MFPVKTVDQFPRMRYPVIIQRGYGKHAARFFMMITVFIEGGENIFKRIDCNIIPTARIVYRETPAPRDIEAAAVVDRSAHGSRPANDEYARLTLREPI